MSIQKLRNGSDRSNVSTASMKTGIPPMEYFWACDLNCDKRSQKWSIPDDEELDEEDEDYIEHSLFVRSICLGAGAVEKEENVVVMESIGESGTVNKGTVANLTKGVNPMCNLSFTIDGKSGVTFSLVEGSGPISICGNYLLEYPKDDDLEMSQTEESRLEETRELEEDEDEEDDEEDEEMEEEKAKSKAVKRKAPAKATKLKQKAKMTVDEDDEDDDEDEDFDEDEEDDESEEEEKVKKGKKETAKKPKGKAKPAQVKDPKKAAKKIKK